MRQERQFWAGPCGRCTRTRPSTACRSCRRSCSLCKLGSPPERHARELLWVYISGCAAPRRRSASRWPHPSRTSCAAVGLRARRMRSRSLLPTAGEVNADIAGLQCQALQRLVAVHVVDVRGAALLDQPVDERLQGADRPAWTAGRRSRPPRSARRARSARRVSARRRAACTRSRIARRRRPPRCSARAAAERVGQRHAGTSATHAEQQAVNRCELERRVVDVDHLDQRVAAWMVHAHASLVSCPRSTWPWPASGCRRRSANSITGVSGAHAVACRERLRVGQRVQRLDSARAMRLAVDRVAGDVPAAEHQLGLVELRQRHRAPRPAVRSRSAPGRRSAPGCAATPVGAPRRTSMRGARRATIVPSVGRIRLVRTAAEVVVLEIEFQHQPAARCVARPCARRRSRRRARREQSLGRGSAASSAGCGRCAPARRPTPR